MKENLIIIDFDHTLFNTTIYVQKLKEVFCGVFHISEKDFDAHRSLIKKVNNVIDIDHFVDSFLGYDSKKLHHAVHSVIKEHAKECVFPDVREFFLRHMDRFDIIIATHGDKELQREKIEHSNLPVGYEYIISTERKVNVISPLISKYKHIYFIDDKAENIEEVKQKIPEIETYFIARFEDHPYRDVCFKCQSSDHVVWGLEFTLLSQK
ncbi:MAG: hypothetical protein COV59_00855 [Candidatus Magasanikbacteria bacterium CG11_big_fil_rev_8_21_14_0_20_39_34]|uniref:Haloacid dehalogenase n=1 Tax=Candidatus Magasanikbacteria bacterium CG11_big_fil_rev_8_21_14_0_20_39_34 TaxID=1974653 RepID=A0A2H0N646_9BACT|nr:MAG: hypothetical protein COV59_00855 [Candidatus Magasanikbacteria bacterium CG11_big_fil_rev_8_21_14_0_20_39_34]